MRLVGWLLAGVMVAGGCASAPSAPEPDSIRAGFAVGSVLTSGAVERRSGEPERANLDSTAAVAGFTELVLDEQVHLRLVGSRQRHDVSGGPGTAALEQVTAMILVGTAVDLIDQVSLQPSLGFGFGYVEVDFDQVAGRVDEHAASMVLAGCLELEFARHVMIGAMVWGGVFGDPGDTEGDFGSAMIYGGVRF